MKRKAFVFHESNYSYDLRGVPLKERYSKWINDLLEQFPDAKFEFHQSIAPFFSEREETEWLDICTLVIVTEN